MNKRLYRIIIAGAMLAAAFFASRTQNNQACRIYSSIFNGGYDGNEAVKIFLRAEYLMKIS